MAHFFTNTLAEIERGLAERNAAHKSCVVYLEGPLGAGKTTFVKEFLAARGALASDIQSPTFLKLLEYPLPNSQLAVHMDCYRMDELKDLEKLSLESYAERAQWFLIEWPELFREYLQVNPALRSLLEPAVYLRLEIEPTPDGDQREIRLHWL